LVFVRIDIVSSLILKRICQFLLAGIFLACSPKKSIPLLELLPPSRTNITFQNTLHEDENLNIVTFEYFYNGAGVGIGDIDNDGLEDIFFAANMSENKLYRNKGHLQFEDITKPAGLDKLGKWATGVSMVDINQDGFLDIYVCYAGPFSDPARRTNELYINNGNRTFTEQASKYGLADTGHSVQAAFFDYDRDGDLDVYILTNITDDTGPNVIRPKRVHGEMINTDRLYRNNGNNTFTDVSTQAGITIEGYGLGVSIVDINQDGWPDVYVTNDYLSNDLLWINQHDGTFIDRAADCFKHTSYSAMGNDVGDINNDGSPDLVSVDMLPPDNQRQKLMFGATNYDRYRSELQYGYAPQFMRNTLQLNMGLNLKGEPCFSEIGQLAGIHATDWSWSPLFADIDNDGKSDLLVTNGYPRDITNRDFAAYKAQEFMHGAYNATVKKKLLDAIRSIDGAHLPPYVFQNNGDLTFTDRSATWGFTEPAYSTGAAYADLDNDGDLDYVTNNINGPAGVFENHADRLMRHHYIRIRFEGAPQNRDGQGAAVTVYQGADSLQRKTWYPYRGYQSSMGRGLHFGLGHHKRIDSLMVLWPDQHVEMLKNLPADTTLTLRWREAVPGTAPDQDHEVLFFDTHVVDFVHHETEYADFKIEPLLPHKFSEGGPGIAVGDVTGDGLEDLFIGGAYKQSGMLFLQQRKGKFIPQPLDVGEKFEEDMGALLFDANGDKELDLYVVSGGNEFAAESPYYQDRLYIHDGRGHFTRRPDLLPSTVGSGSCVVGADYDGDGDTDLFVGGRLTPHRYPQPGQSYLLRNDGGKFTDVTDAVVPGLREVGLVTAAQWTDIDKDSRPDLVVVGEWMPVMVFKNSGGKLVASEVPGSTGWWNSIDAADFDEDGDTDFVLGNLGLNTRYTTSAKEPVSIYVNDLNKDGVPEAMLGYYLQGVNRPAYPRDDLLARAPQLKRKYGSYQAYAAATIDSLYSLAGTVVKRAETLQTSYLENRGTSGWSLHPLPIQAQFAPVYGIQHGDYNGDGHQDLILVGNTNDPDVLTGRYDASKGLMLTGDGHGQFAPWTMRHSGVLIDGAAKGIVTLHTADGGTLIVVAQNNDRVRVLKKTANH
jgi:hypothetical protein